MPPYVTMVAPGASDLAIAVDDAPPTQFRPSFGLGMPADAAWQTIRVQDRFARSEASAHCSHQGPCPDDNMFVAS